MNKRPSKKKNKKKKQNQIHKKQMILVPAFRPRSMVPRGALCIMGLIVRGSLGVMGHLPSRSLFSRRDRRLGTRQTFVRVLFILLSDVRAPCAQAKLLKPWDAILARSVLDRCPPNYRLRPNITRCLFRHLHKANKVNIVVQVLKCICNYRSH